MLSLMFKYFILGWCFLVVQRRAARTRKAFERSVVQWAADASTPECPGCGKAFASRAGALFGASTTRHHCRLCGGIMCKECSLATDVGRAADLVSFFPDLSGGHSENSRFRGKQQKITTSESDLRSCGVCAEMVIEMWDREKQRVEFWEIRELDSVAPPPFERYRKMLTEDLLRTDEVVKSYFEIIDALHDGQGRARYNEAKALYEEYTDLFARIGGYRKKILKLPSRMVGGLASAGDARLQKLIHRQTGEVMELIALGVPKLPTEAEVEERQVARAASFVSEAVLEQHGRTHTAVRWHLPAKWRGLALLTDVGED